MNVSVIIPFYNEEQSLPRCLDSVLAQDGVDMEVILVDDGSWDGSAKICASYAERDARIRYVFQANTGVSAARNRGLAAAKGEYIQFVDADDRVPPGATARLVAAIEDDGADMVACGVRRVVLRGGEEFESSLYPPCVTGLMDADEYVKTFTCSRDDWMHVFNDVWNKLFRLDHIRRDAIAFQVGMASWEDSLFNIHYLAECGKVRVVDDVWYDYLESREVGQIVLSNRYASDLAQSIVRVGEVFEQTFSGWMAPEEMGARLGVVADFLIIAIVNLCRRDAPFPRGRLVETLSGLCQNPAVRRWFNWYRPQPGQSRAIPVLVKYRMPRLLFALARIKAEKRYKPYFTPLAEKRANWRHWFS